jgi:hypothetical protein
MVLFVGWAVPFSQQAAKAKADSQFIARSLSENKPRELVLQSDCWQLTNNE